MLSGLSTALGMPDGYRVPSEAIPDITVTMHNLVTVALDTELSLAFSWPLAKLGTIAVQVSHSNAANTRIDWTIVCNPQVTTSDIFGDGILSAYGLPDDKV